MTYILLADAKDQLSIDPGNTTWDIRINKLIGAAEDWAENFTCRSLGELMEVNSPRDSTAVPLPDPVDSPSSPGFYNNNGNWSYWDGNDFVNDDFWAPEQWTSFWAYHPNPIDVDHSNAMRRDVYAAMLLYLETLFDRNPDNFALLERRATDMLWPYRVALGV